MCSIPLPLLWHLSSLLTHSLLSSSCRLTSLKPGLRTTHTQAGLAKPMVQVDTTNFLQCSSVHHSVVDLQPSPSIRSAHRNILRDTYGTFPGIHMEHSPGHIWNISRDNMEHSWGTHMRHSWGQIGTFPGNSSGQIGFQPEAPLASHALTLTLSDEPPTHLCPAHPANHRNITKPTNAPSASGRPPPIQECLPSKNASHPRMSPHCF